MIVHDVVQGTPEWLRIRLGIPTASCFDRILTPATLKLSKAAESYAHELVAEDHMGEPLEYGSTSWMERGSVLEDEARAWYEMDQDVEVQRVGFVTTDDGRVGCSPDGLVGEDGGLEIKCLSAKNHVACLLGEQITTAGQVQGGMWVTGRKWWDLLAYNPAFPPVLVRVWRDEDYQAALDEAMPQFLRGVETAKRRLALLGERGRREDGQGAVERLRAAVASGADAGVEPGEPLTMDEIEALRNDLFCAVRDGFESQDGADWTRAYALEGHWGSVRREWAALRERIASGRKLEVATL